MEGCTAGARPSAKAAAAKAAVAEERGHEQRVGQADHAVGVGRPEQPDRIRDLEARGARQLEEKRNAERYEPVAAEREGREGQRGERDRPQQSAEEQRQRGFRHPGTERQGADLVQERPQLRVVHVERVAAGVLHEPGHDLGAFDRDLPAPVPDRADEETGGRAGRPHDEHGVTQERPRRPHLCSMRRSRWPTP